MKKVYIYLSLIVVILIIAIIVAGGNEHIGNPRAKEILKVEPNADLIKLDGLVYTPFDSEDNVDYSKGALIGKTNKTWRFGNLYAIKLPKGTKVYTTNSDGYKQGDAPFVMIAELNDKTIIYHALVEG